MVLILPMINCYYKSKKLCNIFRKYSNVFGYTNFYFKEKL